MRIDNSTFLEYAMRQMSPEYGLLSRYKDYVSWRHRMVLKADLEVSYPAEKEAARRLVWC